jgi:hypothetical protein
LVARSVKKGCLAPRFAGPRDHEREPLRSFQTVSTAYCGDIDPHKPCVYERLSKPFGRTVFTHHAMWVNHTEIRCSTRSMHGWLGGSITVQTAIIPLSVASGEDRLAIPGVGSPPSSPCSAAPFPVPSRRRSGPWPSLLGQPAWPACIRCAG